ncbi:translation initiation factor IF-2-like [Rousettus aegyptiacus]|uniref:translation initiation factor IF-2-like n=1 Tax=Rousettus aegyptiacus TaxID=9407 RepID=UPI00168D3555|nr:translation initiation factor IF-2-like [Rousettus aegyptiacus]
MRRPEPRGPRPSAVAAGSSPCAEPGCWRGCRAVSPAPRRSQAVPAAPGPRRARPSVPRAAPPEPPARNALPAGGSRHCGAPGGLGGLILRKRRRPPAPGDPRAPPRRRGRGPRLLAPCSATAAGRRRPLLRGARWPGRRRSCPAHGGQIRTLRPDTLRNLPKAARSAAGWEKQPGQAGPRMSPQVQKPPPQPDCYLPMCWGKHHHVLLLIYSPRGEFCQKSVLQNFQVNVEVFTATGKKGPFALPTVPAPGPQHGSLVQPGSFRGHMFPKPLRRRPLNLAIGVVMTTQWSALHVEGLTEVRSPGAGWPGP